MYYHHDIHAHGSLVPLHLDCILKKKEIGTHEKGGDIYFTTTQKKGKMGGDGGGGDDDRYGK